MIRLIWNRDQHMYYVYILKFGCLCIQDLFQFLRGSLMWEERVGYGVGGEISPEGSLT